MGASPYIVMAPENLTNLCVPHAVVTRKQLVYHSNIMSFMDISNCINNEAMRMLRNTGIQVLLGVNDYKGALNMINNAVTMEPINATTIYGAILERHVGSEFYENILDRFVTMLKLQCPICLLAVYRNEKCAGGKVVPCVEVGCHQLICGTCVLQLLTKTNTCPMCRREPIYVAVPDKYIPETAVAENEENEENEEKMDKPLLFCSTILKIVEQNSNAKILVAVSAIRASGAVDLLAGLKLSNGIEYKVLAGAHTSCLKMMEAYNTMSGCHVLVVSDVVGLNLESTTDIIHIDDLHSGNINDSTRIATDKQLIGRALRTNRVPGLALCVYNFIHDDTSSPFA